MLNRPIETEEAIAANLHQSAKEHLKAFVQRLERLEEDKAAIAEDIKGVYAEAKSNGFDVKALRKIIAIRKKAEHERMEEEAILATYMASLGMLSDLPLGQAATKGMIGHNSGASQEAQEAGEARPHPQIAADLERARERGREAAEDNRPAMDNPYLHADPRHAAWEEGFMGDRRAA